MLTVQELRYRISATDTGFRQTMQGATNTLRRFGEAAQRGITTLRNWSLAASAAGTAITLAFRRINDETVKTAVTIDDLNAKTGISRQRLQELGYAAEQSSADLETLGAGLTRMTRRTAEAAAGNEAYAASYRRLGIEIRDADGRIRDTGDLFLELIERLEQLPDVGERSRIAFNLLGDSGYALLPMLSQGREEIERLMAEANELSRVISDRHIRAFTMYDAAVGRFRSTMRGVRAELAVAVVPIFNQVTQRMETGTRAVVGWIQENRQLVSQLIIMGSLLTSLALGIGLVATGFTVAGRVVGVVTGVLSFLFSPLGLITAAIITLAAAWHENWFDIQDVTSRAVQNIRAWLDSLKKWWNESDLARQIRESWAKVKQIWESDQFTLGEKVIETAKVVVNAVVDVARIAWEGGKDLVARVWEWIKKQLGVDVDHEVGASTAEIVIGEISAVLNALIELVFGTPIQGLRKQFSEWVESQDWTAIMAGIGTTLILAVSALKWAGLTASVIASAFESAWLAAKIGFIGATETLTLGLTLGGLTLALTLIWFSFSEETKQSIRAEVGKLRDRIIETWVENPLRLPIEIFIAVPETLRNLAEIVADELYKDAPKLTPEQRLAVRESGQLFREGAIAFLRGPAAFWEFLQERRETSREKRIAEDISEVIDAVIQGHPHLADFRDVLTEVAEGFVEIAELKGSPLTMGELAELMALVLSESSTVLDDIEAMQNPARVTAAGFEELSRQGVELMNTTEGLARNLEAALELFRLYKQELGDPGSAAGAFLFPSFARRGEWDRPFAGAGDVTGVTAGMKRERYLEILQGIYEGGRTIGVTWAEGLRSSIPVAEAAADEIAGSVADYLIGQSPPPKGELSNVDDPKVGETWIQAIAREIEEAGGDLEAAIKIIADRMWTAMIGFLEERWPRAAEFLQNLLEGGELDEVLESLDQRLKKLDQQFQELSDESIQWTNGLVKGISDAIAYGRDLSSVFDNFLAMLASRFLQTRVFGPLLAGWFPGVLSGLPVFHAGGLVLGGAGALVMHNGGVVPGLRSDEVPAILQIGERVLSRAQNDRFERLLDEWDRNRSEPQEVINYYHINAVDSKSFADLVARNPEAVKAVVIQDVATNGELRKVIRAVTRGG